MDDLSLLIDLHRDNARQGPGGDAETRLAITLSGLAGRRALEVADIGCGTGASTFVLARQLDAHVSAVDLVDGFLDRLNGRAVETGLADRITSIRAPMDALPFAPDSLDAIWAEGAVYNIGFETGVRSWRPLLKAGGILAVSELTWLTAARPAELEDHWAREYLEVDTASAKLAILEAHGYAPLGYFVLPPACWLENYYRPLEAGFQPFLERHARSPAALAIVEAERREIALFRRFAEFYGYGYYIARKLPD